LAAHRAGFQYAQNNKIDQNQPEKKRRIKRVAPKEEEKAEKQQYEIADTRWAGKIGDQEYGEKKEKESRRVKCHGCFLLLHILMGDNF
jgi:hypothetical protein